MNRTENWTHVKGKVAGGFIAMVNKDSPEEEQLRVVEFSDQHRYAMCSESQPYLSMHLFQDERWTKFHNCHVFAAVVGGELVGYAKFIWGHSQFENSRDEVLGKDRKPLTPREAAPTSPQMEMIWFSDLVKQVREDRWEMDDEDAIYPNHLKTWVGAGIGVLDEFRKQGIATALMRTAEEYLETKLKHMGFSLAMDEGWALLKSLGLTDETIIWYPRGAN